MPKPKEQKPPKNDKSQSERFKETARQIGVDETGKEFEKAFGRITPPKKRLFRSEKRDDA